jgi:hypothetical protein
VNKMKAGAGSRAKRRRLGRLAAAFAVLFIILIAAGARSMFSTACAGELETYLQLSQLRRELEGADRPLSAAPAGSSDPDGETPMLVNVIRRTSSAVVASALVVKQNDHVAYRAHVGLANALEKAGCPGEAVRVQWLKAGLHAMDDGAAWHVAMELRRSAVSSRDEASLATSIDALTTREPWSAGIRRVSVALVSMLHP